MGPRRAHLLLGLVVALGCLTSARTAADVTVTHPYAGVTRIRRTETAPRPVVMNIIEIDLSAPGIRFTVTPHLGTLDTFKKTTLQFLKDTGVQIAINAHFFEPWPPPSPDPGAADLVGLAASNGDVYSPFESHPPKSYAIQANAAGLNVDYGNHASIVHRDLADTAGYTVMEPVTLYNAVAGNEQMITNGVNTVPDDTWNRVSLSARTVIGLSQDNRTLFLFTVDKAGSSQGMTVYETAELLRAAPYGLYNALDLDGGGSTTLAMEDPVTGVDTTINVPVSGLRSVGSSLGVFAIRAPTDVPVDRRTPRGEPTIHPGVPNPLQTSTRVDFSLPRLELIDARVVDVNGRLVKRLARGMVSGGGHRLVWDGTDERGVKVASGCYLLQIVHEDGVMCRKLMVVR